MQFPTVVKNYSSTSCIYCRLQKCNFFLGCLFNEFFCRGDRLFIIYWWLLLLIHSSPPIYSFEACHFLCTREFLIQKT